MIQTRSAILFCSRDSVSNVIYNQLEVDREMKDGVLPGRKYKYR